MSAMNTTTDIRDGLTHVYIRRNGRGSYSIMFADGAVSVSFVPSLTEARKIAAHIDAREAELAASKAVRS